VLCQRPRIKFEKKQHGFVFFASWLACSFLDATICVRASGCSPNPGPRIW